MHLYIRQYPYLNTPSFDVVFVLVSDGIITFMIRHLKGSKIMRNLITNIVLQASLVLAGQGGGFEYKFKHVIAKQK